MVLDNIRSAHNVGAIMRTAAGLGVSELWAVGITPYPKQPKDSRLPHVAARADKQIAKTALDAASITRLSPAKSTRQLINRLQNQGFMIIALETGGTSEPLTDYRQTDDKIALVVGHEIDGVSEEWLAASQRLLAIPIAPNTLESFNVAAAAAMALFYLTAGRGQLKA